jgi:dTDP-L-rhamnose 4-epimerase
VKVLVTGGAGFIGSHLVDGLLARGHTVRVLDSLDPQVHGPKQERPAYLNPAAELQVGDVRDHAAVRRALDGVEVVFHQAAAVGVGQSMYEIERYVSVNTLGAAVLLEELVEHRAQLRRVVVASSMSIYGEGAYRIKPEGSAGIKPEGSAGDADGALVFPRLRSNEQLEARRWDYEDARGRALEPAPTPESKPLVPTSVYAVTKRDHEELFLAVGAAYAIPTVALRYFNVYGTRQSLSNPYTGVIAIFSSRLLNGRAPMLFEDGRQSRDFTHVSDIVAANLLAIERDAAVGGVYNVGTGRRASVLEIAETLAREIGVTEAAEVVGRFRAGDIRHCYADVSAAARDLGFEARTSLETGMRELLAWLRTQSAEDRVDQARKELESRGLTR